MNGNHTGKRNGLFAILLVLAVLLAGMDSFTMDVRAETYEDEREAGAGEDLLNAPEVNGMCQRAMDIILSKRTASP